LQYRASRPTLQIPVNHGRWDFKTLSGILQNSLLSMLQVDNTRRPSAKDLATTPQLLGKFCPEPPFKLFVSVLCSDFGPYLIRLSLEDGEVTGLVVLKAATWKALSGEFHHERCIPNQATNYTRPVSVVATVSRDGLYFAAAYGWEVLVWDLRTGFLLSSRETQIDVKVLAFGYSGTWIASSHADYIKIWSIGRVPCRSERYLSSAVTPSSWMEIQWLHPHSDDIHLSAVCYGSPNSLVTWNTVAGSRVRSVNLEIINRLRFYLDTSSMIPFSCDTLTGPCLATFQVGHSIRIMDLISGKITSAFTLPQDSTMRTTSRCGRYFLCGYSNGTIEVWSLSGPRTGERIVQLQGEGSVYSLDLSFSGKYLVSSHLGMEVKEHLMTWSLDLQCTSTIPRNADN
jgi:WD40 repeat protein